MTYIVVETIVPAEFVEAVNAWISRGFKPLGGISTNGKTYVQAMVSANEPKVIAEPIKAPQPKDIKIVKTASELRGMFPVVRVRYSYRDKLHETELEDMDRDITRDSIILACLEDIMAREGN